MVVCAAAQRDEYREGGQALDAHPKHPRGARARLREHAEAGTLVDEATPGIPRAVSAPPTIWRGNCSVLSSRRAGCRDTPMHQRSVVRAIGAPLQGT